MDHADVARFWDGNAETWTRLSRSGYDVWRDEFNTPAFLRMLPAVGGLRGLDVGCGEGHNTRQLARFGAWMTGVDISGSFIAHAVAEERARRLGIGYVCASAACLPFAGDSFDFVTAFMSLMDMADQDRVLAEIARTLRPGGFVQFSIEHPTSVTPKAEWVRDSRGTKVARTVGGYFDQRPWVSEWIFSAVPAEVIGDRPRFRIPRFPRTLSSWLNAIVAAGLVLEESREPFAGDTAVARFPQLAETRIAPMFWHVRARKPGGEAHRTLRRQER